MQLTSEVKENILTHTRVDTQNCGSACTDYRIMRNVYTPGMWYMRYTKAHIEQNVPEQFYRWLCFDESGNQVDCDPVFEKVSNKNQFYRAMIEVEAIERIFVME